MHPVTVAALAQLPEYRFRVAAALKERDRQTRAGVRAEPHHRYRLDSAKLNDKQRAA